MQQKKISHKKKIHQINTEEIKIHIQHINATQILNKRIPISVHA